MTMISTALFFFLLFPVSPTLADTAAETPQKASLEGAVSTQPRETSEYSPSSQPTEKLTLPDNLLFTGGSRGYFTNDKCYNSANQNQKSFKVDFNFITHNTLLMVFNFYADKGCPGNIISSSQFVHPLEVLSINAEENIYALDVKTDPYSGDPGFFEVIKISEDGQTFYLARGQFENVPISLIGLDDDFFEENPFERVELGSRN